MTKSFCPNLHGWPWFGSVRFGSVRQTKIPGSVRFGWGKNFRFGRFLVLRNPEKACSISSPVRICFSRSASVSLILNNAKNLTQSSEFYKTYVSPDQCPEERVIRRKLVEKLRVKIEEEPRNCHFIRGGEICSTDSLRGIKTDTTTPGHSSSRADDSINVHGVGHWGDGQTIKLMSTPMKQWWTSIAVIFNLSVFLCEIQDYNMQGLRLPWFDRQTCLNRHRESDLLKEIYYVIDT